MCSKVLYSGLWCVVQWAVCSKVLFSGIQWACVEFSGIQ